MNLICDCKACKTTPNHHEIVTDEYIGETYSECAKAARKDGWKLSRNKMYCTAKGHGVAVKYEDE